MHQINFYYDYISPYAYLANSQLSHRGLPVTYCPVSILDVMRLVNNQPSPKCPPKLKYALADTQRWARRYGVRLEMNAAWWCALEESRIDMRLFSSGALAAQKMDCFAAYHSAIFGALWGQPRDVLGPRARVQLLEAYGIDGDALWAAAEDHKAMAELDACNAAAVQAGVFGVPTFLVNDELFFGNDRLDFVAEACFA